MKKSGQVWIETVLYTLIGLTLIGLALGFIMPKVNEARDKIVVEQAINSIGALDERITESIQRGTGNVREIEISMKRGEMYIDGNTDEIRFVIKDLVKPYSQPGVEIGMGRVKVNTTLGQKTSSVTLRVPYVSNVTNITYGHKDQVKPFTASSVPYKFTVANVGVIGNKIVIDIEEISNR